MSFPLKYPKAQSKIEGISWFLELAIFHKNLNTHKKSPILLFVCLFIYGYKITNNTINKLKSVCILQEYHSNRYRSTFFLKLFYYSYVHTRLGSFLGVLFLKVLNSGLLAARLLGLCSTT
jgi:hypothetical protein